MENKAMATKVVTHTQWAIKLLDEFMMHKTLIVRQFY